MNPQQVWQSVLSRLQGEIERASFDTWVRDTEALSLIGNVLTVSARNAYARDWLESRLTNTVQRMLTDILNQIVTVRFVDRNGSNEETESDEEDEQEVEIEPVQWLDYDRIVQPHKQVVVKGYLRRLAVEIGPKAIWLYIGFHQAAWRVHEAGGAGGMALHSREIMRFSGLPNGTFWRLLKQPSVQQSLAGLVQRVDPPHEPRFRRGRDGRPHRAPVRYQVCMTPRLTHADAAAIHSRLKVLLTDGKSIQDALQELTTVEEIRGLLTPAPSASSKSDCNTVMDMARLAIGERISPEIERLAQELHRRITNFLGDIHITHYFIEKVIPGYNLTPAQAWLVSVARDMAYLNWRTGERREIVTFKRGYQEMAELVGSKRYKTVQAWLNPAWASQKRGADLTRFLVEVEAPESRTYPDLRVGSMPRAFRVLLDEPVDANGSHSVDANGSHMADAGRRISQSQMGELVDANGSHMVDANGSDLNTLKHSINTFKENTSTTQHAHAKTVEGVAPPFWELKALLQQNDVHPKVQKELLEVQASVQAFVSWVLYVASPQSGNLSDPLGYAISRLREHPMRTARGIFRQLAGLPPSELLSLIDSTPARDYDPPRRCSHPLFREWKKVMGYSNRRLPAVRAILFGEGEE
ncbi:MAG: DnaA N-terminal domain-containing protein [Chloroflexota bacterium]